MRHHSSHPIDVPANQATRDDWTTLKTLLPYLLEWKWRVLLALVSLVAAKMANVGVPLVLKQLIDKLAPMPGNPAYALVVPVGLLIAYGLLRLSATVFTELREFFFARVTQRAVRTIALKVFRHLHALSLRFHLNRQTGGVTRENAERAVSRPSFHTRYLASCRPSLKSPWCLGI